MDTEARSEHMYFINEGSSVAKGQGKSQAGEHSGDLWPRREALLSEPGRWLHL